MKPERESITGGIFAILVMAALIFPAVFDGGDADAGPKKSEKTLCAWFGQGGSKYSRCTSDPKTDAQKKCDAELKSKGLEGTCDCTDDPDFINGRCN